MYHLCFYVPESHLAKLKTALFDAGAGKVGAYDSCAWETKGRGQFRPLQGSSPFLGKVNTIEYVAEYRVEMVCDEDCIEAVLHRLMAVHPYETPAYWVTQVKTLKDFAR